MAIDPRISLAATAPIIQPPDLVGTMVAAGRLREQQSINNLRDLQAYQAAEDYAADQRIAKIIRDHYASQGGMGVPGGALPSPAPLTPSPLARPAMPAAVTQTPLGATPAPPTAGDPFGTGPGINNRFGSWGTAKGTPIPEAPPPASMSQPAALPGQPAPASPMASGVPKEGYLGVQDLGGGNIATVLTHTVTEPSINGGRPTNIPLIVPGISPEEIKAIARGAQPSEEAYGRSIRHAQQRLANGEQIPSYSTIDEAVAAAKSESAQRGQANQPPGVAPPPAPAPDTGAAAPPPPPAPAPGAGAGAPAATPTLAPTPLPGMQMMRRPPYEQLLGEGRRGMVAVQGLQQMESAEQTRQASQQTQQLNQAKTLEAGITYMQHALALPTDQATYDAMLQKMASDGPAYAQMAAQLPKTYDPAQVEATLRRLAMIKQRAQGNQLGMQPIPATRDGKHIILRMAPGGLEEAQAPPGVEVTPQGVIREDTGTEIILRDRAGNILSRQPKEVQKAAEQKATGTASGKAAGELPEKLRDAQTTIASIGDQHGRVNKAIDAALSTMDRPGELPATGTVSTLYNVFGETNARMLRNQLKIIVSNMGLDQLLTLAKAGGRLGSVTEAEHKLLQSTIAALDPEGTVDSIKQQLQNVRDAVVQSRQRIQEAYDRDVAALQQAQPGTGQRQPGQGTPPRTVIPKDQAERVIQQFIQQGGTREQILETWRQKHIEVGQ